MFGQWLSPLAYQSVLKVGVEDQNSTALSNASPNAVDCSNLEISAGLSGRMDPDQIRRLWEHGLHEENVFNDRLNFFLIFESVLLGVVGMLYSKQPAVMKSVLVIMACLGFLITIIWGYIQARQRSILKRLIERLEQHLPEFRETHAVLKRKKWRRLSSTVLLAHVIPLLISLVWLALLIVFLK